MSYSAWWIRISAARHEGLRYGLGRVRFMVSEHVVKIRLPVIGFGKDNLPSVIEPGKLERGG